MRRLILLVAAAATTASCSSKPASDAGSLTPAFLDTPVAGRPQTTAATIGKGKEVYDANCVQCLGSD